MARWFFLGFLACVGCSFVGCSESRPQPVKVSGTVNLDREPLAEGEIILIGEGGGAPETFPVKDGKFEGKALPGKKRVEIRAFRPGTPTQMGEKTIEASPVNYLPDRFNTESKLKAEVGSDGGLNPSHFDVQKD